MEYVIQLFGAIPLSTVIVFIAAVVFLIGIGAKFYSFIVDNHDKQQEKDETLKQIAEDIRVLKDNQIRIERSVDHLKEKQEEISVKQNEIETRNRLHDLNKLRDKLLQSYRFYADKNKNPLQMWSEMEKEAFDNLFKDYEELGGNGFMHSTVEPAMSQLGIVSMNDATGLINLMQSRKG